MFALHNNPFSADCRTWLNFGLSEKQRSISGALEALLRLLFTERSFVSRALVCQLAEGPPEGVAVAQNHLTAFGARAHNTRVTLSHKDRAQILMLIFTP